MQCIICRVCRSTPMQLLPYVTDTLKNNNGSSFMFISVLGTPCRRSPRYEEEEGCRVASAVCKRNRRTRAHFEKWMKNSVVKVQ